MPEINLQHSAATADKVGVLLLNLGGPETLDDVEHFLFNLFNDPDIIRLPAQGNFRGVASRQQTSSSICNRSEHAGHMQITHLVFLQPSFCNLCLLIHYPSSERQRALKDTKQLVEARHCAELLMNKLWLCQKR